MKASLKNFLVLLASTLTLCLNGCSSNENEDEIVNNGVTAQNSTLDGAWRAVSRKKAQTIDGHQSIIWEETFNGDEEEIILRVFKTSTKKIIRASLDRSKSNPQWYISAPYNWVYDSDTGIYYVGSSTYRIINITNSSLTIESFEEVNGITKSSFTTYNRINNLEELIGQPLDWEDGDPQDMSIIQKNIKENRFLLAQWTSGTTSIAFSLYADGTCKVKETEYKWSYDSSSKILALTNGMTFTIKSLTSDMLVAEYSSGTGNNTYTWIPSCINYEIENVSLFFNGKWKRTDGSVLTINDNNFSFVSSSGINISGVWRESMFKWKYEFKKENGDGDANPLPILCWNYNGVDHYYGKDRYTYDKWHWDIMYEINPKLWKISESIAMFDCSGPKLIFPQEWTTNGTTNRAGYSCGYTIKDGELTGEYTYME